jgi:hypothetical protein
VTGITPWLFLEVLVVFGGGGNLLSVRVCDLGELVIGVFGSTW